jgi:hypothetical protein
MVRAFHDAPRSRVLVSGFRVIQAW